MVPPQQLDVDRTKRRFCSIKKVKLLWWTTLVLALYWNMTQHLQLVEIISNTSSISVDGVSPPPPSALNRASNKEQQNQYLPWYETCIPTHTSCLDDNNQKKKYKGLLHIESGDYGGAGGTIFFQFVIGQLLYAEAHQLLPFVHFNNFSHLVYDPLIHDPQPPSTNNQEQQRHHWETTFQALKGMTVSTIWDPRLRREAGYPGRPILKHVDDQPGTLTAHNYTLQGTGVWNHYFQQPVPDFCPGDRSCQGLPLLKMEPFQVSPGLHRFASWSPKVWRYNVMPAYVAKPQLDLFVWLYDHRKMASRVVQQYYRWPRDNSGGGTNDIVQLHPYFVQLHQRQQGQSSFFSNSQQQQQRTSVMTTDNRTTSHCLGIHVRWSDKGGNRRRLGLIEFLPYIQAYVEQVQQTATISSSDIHQQPCIYVATDSTVVLSLVEDRWMRHFSKNSTSSSPSTNNIQWLFSQASVRSPNETAVFDMGVSHHVTNLEILQDIVGLSKCQFLLHGNSAVSEAAMYLHADLIHQSVNLEDPVHRTPAEFADLVAKVRSGKITSKDWKNYQIPLEWWEDKPDLLSSSSSPMQQSSCDPMNTTLILNHPIPNDFSFPIKKWVRQVFVELPHQLATRGVVQVDRMWYKWFESDPFTDCRFDPAILPGDAQAALSKLVDSYSIRADGTTGLQPEALAIRQTSATLLSHLIKIHPYIQKHADEVFPLSGSLISRSDCMGIHIPDPAYHRDRKTRLRIQNVYPKAVYEHYITQFRKNGGQCLYLASDSASIWQEFYQEDSNITKGLTVYTQSSAIRNIEMSKIHHIEERMQRLGIEALVDILNLMRCGSLVHGSFAVSEAALAWNSTIKSFHVLDPMKPKLAG